MNLQDQYLADIELYKCPYPDSPAKRIAKIYGTARRGQISGAFSCKVWEKHFVEIHALATNGKLAATEVAFDEWLVSEVLTLASLLRVNGKGDFGIAQKMINLFLKDLWGFGFIETPIEKLLHAPIDRRVLAKFKVIPNSWNSWSKASSATDSSKTVKDYLLLQKELRNLWKTSPIRFPSVIQMEQFIWHQIS